MSTQRLDRDALEAAMEREVAVHQERLAALVDVTNHLQSLLERASAVGLNLWASDVGALEARFRQCRTAILAPKGVQP